MALPQRFSTNGDAFDDVRYRNFRRRHLDLSTLVRTALGDELTTGIVAVADDGRLGGRRRQLRDLPR
jgi:hypothetical protein